MLLYVIWAIEISYMHAFPKMLVHLLCAYLRLRVHASKQFWINRTVLKHFCARRFLHKTAAVWETECCAAKAAAAAAAATPEVCDSTLDEHLWDCQPLPSALSMDVISDLTTGICEVPDKLICPDLGELSAGESEQSSYSAESLGKCEAVCWWTNLFFMKWILDEYWMTQTTAVECVVLNVCSIRQRGQWCFICILRVMWVVLRVIYI